MKYWLLVGSFLLYALTAAANTGPSPNKVLRVYGPGGPHHVMEECAELFQQKSGIEVIIEKALPHNLDAKIDLDGDIYYGGAECMLEEFTLRNPGILDLSTVERLHPRKVGIIVRKGNPYAIETTEDLAQKGVHLLDVRLENMRDFHGSDKDLASNIRRFVYTGQQGLAAWHASPEIDAWVTYKSWHIKLRDGAEFIEIPEDDALRFTPAALTLRTPHREEAQSFLAFLKSEEAQDIFRKHGWY